MKEEMLNSLLFYYIYTENVAILLLSAECIVCLTHDCLSFMNESLPVILVSLWLLMGTADLSSCEVQCTVTLCCLAPCSVYSRRSQMNTGRSPSLRDWTAEHDHACIFV